MQFPDKCPNCGKNFDGEAYLVQRAAPDWDSDKPDRIEDSISECSNCHSLFRLKWKLESFDLLIDLQAGKDMLGKLMVDGADGINKFVEAHYEELKLRLRRLDPFVNQNKKAE